VCGHVSGAGTAPELPPATIYHGGALGSGRETAVVPRSDRGRVRSPAGELAHPPTASKRVGVTGDGPASSHGGDGVRVSTESALGGPKERAKSMGGTGEDH
jgi:hypothetical protein